MKKISQKITSSILSIAIAISICPIFLRENVYAATSYNKYTANTMLRTSKILSANSSKEEWLGGYVYFGKYNETPMKFRVLKPQTSDYGSNTIFLDCDSILYEDYFDRDKIANTGASMPNEWAYSDLKTNLNGSRFLEKENVFTIQEKNSIANSVIAGNSWDTSNDPIAHYDRYVGLTGEKIFVLDVQESRGNGKYYNGELSKYWFRTPDIFVWEDRTMATGSNSIYSDTSSSVVNKSIGVSPAMNIDISKILFSSLLSGTISSVTEKAEYKFTLIDEDIKIEIPNNSVVHKSGVVVGIPYKISGDNAKKANAISILITDKPYDVENAKILHYSKVSKNTSDLFSESTARFYFPSINGKWGTDYHVYIIAENINDIYETDYASIPLEISAPEKGGLISTNIGTITNGEAYLTPITSTAKPSNTPALFEGELVGVETYPDPGFEIDKITYTPKGENAIDITTSKLFKMPNKEVTVNVTFKKITYDISLGSINNGSASLSTNAATENTTISVSVSPNPGYEVDKVSFSTISGVKSDITTSLKFSMPSENVVVYVEFRKITVPSQQNIPTNVPNNAPTTITNNTPSDEISFKDFVERLYVVALNRASEPEGKAYWCEHVGNGDLTGAACAREFLFSAEFRGRNLSDEDFVKVLYKTFFDRDAANDPEGYNFWLKTIKTEGRDRAINGFINSTEWCNICATYGVKSGAQYAKATTASKNATAFAERLYTKCLNRDAEEGGLTYWSLALTNLEISGSSAAKQFFNSPEFIGFNTSNEEYLTRLYRTFMGREPDDEGLNYWLGCMNNGMTRDGVFDNFVASPEFTGICKEYGIDR